MIIPDTLINSLYLVFAYMIFVWLISLLVKNAGIADIFWGPGFVLISMYSLFSSNSFTARAMLVCAMTIIWGLRLAVHIFLRNLGHEEDYRYAAMRKRAGSIFPLKSLFTVFLFQGIIMVVVSLPLQFSVVMSESGPFSIVDIFGLVVWLTGFYFEVVSDLQLARFKAESGNIGKPLTKGLWALTRHPNYFGEFLMWWGLFIIALSVNGGMASIVSPLLMSFLIMKVSGVPMLEKKLKEKPGYEEYVSSTPAFFPKSQSKK